MKSINEFVSCSGLSKTVASVCCLMGMTLSATAVSVTSEEAVEAVKGWTAWKEALGEQLTAAPASVQEYHGIGGTGTYYVVSLEGGGYVVTSGDTALEPVLAYSKEGEWVDDSARNPLKVMVEIDVAAAMMAELSSAIKSGGDSTGGRRLAATASVQQQGGAANDGSTAQMAELGSANAAKWAKYKAAASTKGGRRLQASAPSSDLRVSPLIQSAWNQSTQSHYHPIGMV